MGEWKMMFKIKNTPGLGHNEGERLFSLTPNPPEGSPLFRLPLTPCRTFSAALSQKKKKQ